MKEYLKTYVGKNILVTGGLGFIGSNLVHEIASVPDMKITIVDSLAQDMGGNRNNLSRLEKPVEVCIVDMADRARMNEFVQGMDYIFNLAGQISHIDSMADPFQDLHANYLAQISLLEACRRHNPEAKIVFSSTRQVYGRIKSLPARESHPASPVDMNGINKLAAEKSHLLYHDVYGVKSAVMRLVNTYGPRQLVKHPRQGFIGWFIRKAMDGEEIEIFGDGNQLRSLIYVEDVVAALLLAGAQESTYGKIFNLGFPRAFTLQYIAELLIEITGRGSYRLVDFPEERKRIDIGSAQLDFSSFHEHTGWTPNVSLEDGLRRTVSFYEQHREWYW